MQDQRAGTARGADRPLSDTSSPHPIESPEEEVVRAGGEDALSSFRIHHHYGYKQLRRTESIKQCLCVGVGVWEKDDWLVGWLVLKRGPCSN